MWTMLKALVVQAALAKVMLRGVGSLGVFLPAAFLLKLVGFKTLAVLGLLSVPMLLMLLVFGLPIFLVLAFGGVLLAVIGIVLSLGILSLPILVPILLVAWLVRSLLRRGRPTTGPGIDPAV